MNKIKITDNGGQPLFRKDMNYLNIALLETFKGLLSAYGDNFILSGCNLDQPDEDLICSEGFIMLNGEVFYVPENTVVNIGVQTPYFDIDLTYDHLGYKQFYDQTYKECWEVRRAKLYASLTPPLNYMPANAPSMFVSMTSQLVANTIAQKCNEKLADNQNAWNLVTSQFLNSFANKDANTYYAMAYRRNSLGKVELRGSIYCTTSLAYVESADIMTLPYGYRPDKSMTIPCVVVFTQTGTDNTWYHCHLRINPDGIVKFIDSAGVPYYWSACRLEIHTEFPI